MSSAEWMVLLAGASAIALVNWYFFFSARTALSVPAPPVGGEVAQVVIAVKGGYDPAMVRVQAGKPVRLVFDRRENSSCSEEIVFPDFNIKRFLPAFQKTTIEITPPRPGKYEFTCGMSMLHGAIVAEDQEKT